MAKMTIDIDERLLAKALDLSGAKTKKEAVHQAIDHYVRRMAQNRSMEMLVSGRLAGTVHWTGEEFLAWRKKGDEKIEKIRKQMEEKGITREPSR
jgi:Arc/MetJ family transcription regulator